MEGEIDRFDNSRLDKNDPLYDPVDAKELGLFKDEANGVPIAEVVCISAKMYCLRTKTLNRNYSEINFEKCKGKSKSVVIKNFSKAI